MQPEADGLVTVWMSHGDTVLEPPQRGRAPRGQGARSMPFFVESAVEGSSGGHHRGHTPLRARHSPPEPTRSWARLPYDLPGRISSRIITEAGMTTGGDIKGGARVQG